MEEFISVPKLPDASMSAKMIMEAVVDLILKDMRPVSVVNGHLILKDIRPVSVVNGHLILKDIRPVSVVNGQKFNACCGTKIHSSYLQKNSNGLN